MKRFIFLTGILTLTAALFGCTGKLPAQSTSNPPSASASPKQSEPEQSLPEIGEIQPMPMPTVPPINDAIMYRGTITEITLEKDGVVALLEQAEGTNFGHRAMRGFLDPESSFLTFDIADIQVGDYLEIFYGGALALSEPPFVTAIQAYKLLAASLVLYNGELVEIMEDGSLVLNHIGSMPGDEQHVFHIDDATQVYMNLDDLVPGAKLNIFYNGIATRSLPPQSTAQEVRPFAES